MSSTAFSTTKANVWTRLDSTGSLFGVTRVPGEDLVSYKKRLLLTFIEKQNATNNGVVNTLLSKLGYEKLRVLKIEMKDGVEPSTYPRRAIIKTDNKLLLCKNYLSMTDYVEDYSIELRERPYVSIPDVVTLINANSDVFKATLINSDTSSGYGSNDYIKIAKGFTLINTSSYKTARQKIGKSTLTVLDHKFVERGSLVFEDTIAFNTEIYTEATLDNNVQGNFFVDYDEGIVKTVSVPSKESDIIYNYIDDVIYLYHTPVPVSSVVSDDAKKYLFDEKPSMYWTSDFNKTYSGLPKKEMIEMVHELKRVANIYWGI